MKGFVNSNDKYSLWLLLAQTRHAIMKARQRELAIYGISNQEGYVLFAINYIGDQATPAELSRWLLREPHSVSELLDRMEKKGLIRKVKDMEQKNRIRVVMSEKGREIFNKSTTRKSINKVISILTPEEQEQLSSLLHKMRKKALKEIRWEGAMPYPL